MSGADGMFSASPPYSLCWWMLNKSELLNFNLHLQSLSLYAVLRLFTGAGIMLWYCESLKGKSQRVYPLLCRNVDTLRGCQPLSLSLLHFLPSSNLPLYLHSVLSLFYAYIPVFCPFFILHSSVLKAHPNALKGRWNLCLLPSTAACCKSPRSQTFFMH